MFVVVLVLVMGSCSGKNTKSGSSGSESDVSASNESDNTPGETSGGASDSDIPGESTGGSSGSSGGGNGTSSGKPPSTTQPGGSSNVELAGTVNVQSGTSSLDQSLNFGGKSFTMAITEEPQYSTNAFKRMVAAFESKYNCKIKLVQLVFNTYNQQMTQAMSSGTPYDIAFSHGSMFPSNVISGLAADMGSVITTADYMSESNPSAGGIDIYKSSYFSWNGKLYGLCTFSADSVYPYLIYYNKQLFKNNGLDDPMDLYNSGKWSWNMIRTMGRQVTDTSKNLYFLSSSFVSYGSYYSYGTPFVTMKNGTFTENLSSQNVMTSLNMMQNFFASSLPIGTETDNGAQLKYDKFYDGSRFMFLEESMKYPMIADNVVKSQAFGRSKNNLGIVPVPLDSANKDKAYPTGWMFATYAGKGSSDPRAAAAWVKFRQTYKDPVTDANAMSADQSALVNKLLSGKIIFPHGVFATSSYTTLALNSEIHYFAYKKVDLASSIANIRPKYQEAIRATIS